MAENTMQNATNKVDRAIKAAFDKIMRHTQRFVRFDLARDYAARPPKRLWVMLGDDGRYWVTTPANCARLEEMGYEYADPGWPDDGRPIRPQQLN